MALVEIRDVTKTYPSRTRGGHDVRALDGVSLDVEAGEIVGVVGYSGAGKSTLVRLVNALERPTSGTVTVEGVEVSALSERRLSAVRQGIGMIFQQFNLLSSRTVYGNVAYPLQVAGVPRGQAHERIAELLTFVGLADKAHSHVEQLSGGQKQRVGIARALATSPALLLADEATSALDPDTTQEVLALLRRVNAELGVTIVLITHEMEVVKALAHRVVVMEQGRVVEEGPVFDVFSAPQEPVTRRFVATVVDDLPSPSVLERLRANNPGRYVRVAFRDTSAPQAEVYATLAQHGVAFEIVHGGIEDVGGRTFGNLTLALRGASGSVDDALRRLAPVVDLEEL